MSNTSTKLLAIDVGNTSITFGYFKGGKLVKTARLATADYRKVGSLVIRQFPYHDLSAAVIGSVVPKAGLYIRKALRAGGLKTHLVGRDISVPIKNRARRPKQVGADRLLSAAAFYHRYKRAGIVVDFGTAITFDAVSAKGEYLGGAIAPGVEISLDALFERTALLPKIKLSHPKSVIGRDTIESIRAGCAWGIGGTCDRIVEQMRLKLGPKALVLATGGYASFMRRYCHSIRTIDPNLVLKGLYITLAK